MIGNYNWEHGPFKYLKNKTFFSKNILKSSSTWDANEGLLYDSPVRP